ncbi:hypothetical protein [Psychrobacter celer]|uniref:hypothetical protein n=1 Tax=Psychrobacter celer TaxID=306572 RepID=UPI003FD2AB75
MSENQVVVAPTKKRNTLAQAAVAFAVIGATNAALAEDNITALGTGVTENISAALTVALGIFAIGVGIIGTFKGYQYLKSGVNKA